MSLELTDETVRLRKNWRKTLVGPEDTIVITYLPLGGGMRGGGGGGGKSILGAVAMIALSVFAPMVVGALGPAFAVGGQLTLVGKIVTAGLVAGVGYFISKATQPKANKEEQDRPVYGVQGGGNMPRPGDRIPVHYGTVWHQPDLSQNDYFYYKGEDMILLKRLTVGLGDYVFEEIRVGQAVMWRGSEENGTFNGNRAPFKDTTIEIIKPNERSSLVPSSVYSAPEVTGSELARSGDDIGWTGPFVVVPQGETTNRIQIDYSLPQGLYAFTNSGKKVGHVTWLNVQYAEVDEEDRVVGSWKTLFQAEHRLNTTRAQRFTRYENVPEGRYAVRANNGQPRHDDKQWYDTINWDGARAWLDKAPRRPGITELALKIASSKGTGNMNFSDIWVKMTRKLPMNFGAGWMTPTKTRKAVWAALDILHNQSYGNASPDAKIDFDTFLHYETTVDEFNTFDGTIRGPVPVLEGLSMVLGVIRAEPLLIGDVWSMTRDEPRQVRKHVITRRQILKDTSGAMYDLDMSDGSSDVIVEWFTDGDPRQRQERRYTIGEETLTPRRINLFGVSNFQHAEHLGKWHSAVAFHRREHRMISTELLGRNLARNDSALIDLWFLDEQKAAGVDAVSGSTVTLDADVPISAGDHVLFRNQQGKEWGPVGITGSIDRHITLNSADITTVENWTGQTFASLFTKQRRRLPVTALIGPLQELTQPYIIKRVVPDSEYTVQVEAVIDADEVWQILGEPPATDPPIIDIIATETDVVPVLPWISAQVVQKATTVVVDWAVGDARAAVRYQVDVRYMDNEDEDGGWEPVSNGAATDGSYTVEWREETQLQVRARCFNAQGVPSEFLYTVSDLVKPVINDFYAQLMIQITDLQEQVRKDIQDINRIGAETLEEGKNLIRNQLKDLRERVDELAAAAATSAAHDFDRRDFNKLEMITGLRKTQAAIEEEAKIRLSETSALAEQTTSLMARLDDEETGIGAVATTVDSLITAVELTGEGPTARSEKITSLETKVNDPARGVDASATAVDQLKTAVGFKLDGASASADKITALQTAIMTPGAGLNGAATAVDKLATAVDLRTDGSGNAYAAKITAVEATLNGTSGLISQVSEVRGTVGMDGKTGLLQRYGVTFAANGAAYGGYEMTGIVQNDGSRVVNFGIQGNLVVDGSITGTKLSARTIEAGKIRADTVIIESVLQVGGSTVDTTQVVNRATSNTQVATGSSSASKTMTIRAGSQVLVMGFYEGDYNTARSDPVPGILRLWRDSTILKTVDLSGVWNDPWWFPGATSVVDLDTVTGSNTYKVECSFSGGVTLVVMELAR